ncbi:hypothetical protein, partial [Nitrobacter winogradskyi]|uniref:hypothetical protein n=1 Tax=Nitrobacter winogradskyi TaxID=913 RepID=UPI001AEE9DAF
RSGKALEQDPYPTGTLRWRGPSGRDHAPERLDFDGNTLFRHGRALSRPSMSFFAEIQWMPGIQPGMTGC